MNKEQAIKHTGCIQSFLDNPDKGVWCKDPGTDWVLTLEPNFLVQAKYVQNDEYAELRKLVIDKPDTQLQVGYENYTEWFDKSPNKAFSMQGQTIRIKPEECVFKVGDWVQHPDYDTFQADKLFVAKMPDTGTDKTWKLWEPQSDELCVFWNSEHMHYTLGKYSHTQHGDDYIKQGDLSYYDNIAPLEFVMKLKGEPDV